MTKPRKFRHTNGFSDGTDYVMVTNTGSYIIGKDGSIIESERFTIDRCLRAVNSGQWYELTDNLVPEKN